MARIAYDQSDIRVQQRLIDSFWLLLETLPFRKVTISRLVELASCNRASFYYHYQDTGDLLQKALEQELVDELGVISIMADSLAGSKEARCASLSSHPRLLLAFRQVQRELLSERLQFFFLRLWTVVLCSEGEELVRDARELIAFFVDGLLGALLLPSVQGDSGLGLSVRKMSASCVEELGSLYGLDGGEVAARLRMINRVWSSLS